MRKTLFSVVVLYIAIIGISLNISAQTARNEIANPTNFEKIEVARNLPVCNKSLKLCGQEVLVSLDLAGFGGDDSIKFAEEVFTFPNGVGIYLSSITGYQDGAKTGERTRVAFQKTQRGYEFVQIGTQNRCQTAKGSVWTKSACAGTASKQTSQNEIADSNDFRFINITGRGAAEASAPCSGNLSECGAQKAVIYGYEGFGGPETDNFREETFTFTDKKTGRNVGIYLLTMTGFEDDSVEGERVRIEFVRKGNIWQWTQSARQFKCARGAGAGKWTKELCP